MRLKSFGCSFVFGNDLPDDGRDLRRATPSALTWPALVARDLGLSYHCYARPGSGNLQIMEAVLNQLAVKDTALFVIGWSWIDRFDYTDPHSQAWSTLMPIDQRPQAENYYRHLHSEYRDKLASLSAIYTAVQALESQAQAYVMTYMDDLLFDTRYHQTPAVSQLQGWLAPRMTQFQGKNFLDWSRQQGHAISDTLHPLEQAHRAAADLLLETCRAAQSA